MANHRRRQSHDLQYDGRTLLVTVVLDVRDTAHGYEAASLVHHTCRGPLERMASGFSEAASDNERKELGELLSNYGVIVRLPMCIRVKELINTDEDSEQVAYRIRDVLNPRNMKALVIVGEADTTEAAKAWRHHVAAARKFGLIQ